MDLKGPENMVLGNCETNVLSFMFKPSMHHVNTLGQVKMTNKEVIN